MSKLLWSWTIQGFLPKAPYDSGETEADFRPYGVGYVEMPAGIKVESRPTVADPAALRTGMRMALTLVLYRVAPDGEPVFTYAFAPAFFGLVRSLFRDPNHAIVAVGTAAVVVQVLAIWSFFRGVSARCFKKTAF